MKNRPSTTIALTTMLAILLLTLPATITLAGEQTATEQQQKMTPEQRREKMLQQLLKLSPEERRQRQERYKTMTAEEQQQYEKDHPKEITEEKEE